MDGNKMVLTVISGAGIQPLLNFLHNSAIAYTTIELFQPSSWISRETSRFQAVFDSADANRVEGWLSENGYQLIDESQITVDTNLPQPVADNASGN